MNKQTIKAFFLGVIITGVSIWVGCNAVDNLNKQAELKEKQLQQHIEMIYGE